MDTGKPYTLYYDGVRNAEFSTAVQKQLKPGGALYLGVYPTNKDNLIKDSECNYPCYSETKEEMCTIIFIKKIYCKPQMPGNGKKKSWVNIIGRRNKTRFFVGIRAETEINTLEVQN